MKTVRRDSHATRQALLDAAEQLFAERGVENVSLLDIGRAAGQKNRNAPQYHFGDKERLVHAVLDRHTDRIAERRRTLLEQLEAAGEPALHDLVRLFVMPVAEHVASTPNGHTFLLLNAQLMTSPPHAEARQQRVAQMPEVKRMSELFAERMPALAPRHRRARLLLMQSMLMHGLASFHCQYPSAEPRHFVTELCRGIEAMLCS